MDKKSSLCIGGVLSTVSSYRSSNTSGRFTIRALCTSTGSAARVSLFTKPVEEISLPPGFKTLYTIRLRRIGSDVIFHFMDILQLLVDK